MLFTFVNRLEYFSNKPRLIYFLNFFWISKISFNANPFRKYKLQVISVFLTQLSNEGIWLFFISFIFLLI